METLGLWTPYSRGMIRKIAMRMTLHSGLSIGLATGNLLLCETVVIQCMNDVMSPTALD